MLLYRVFPHLATSSPGEPGHPLYVNPGQGYGRWDNPDLYHLAYMATTPEGAVGETFAHLSMWSKAMLAHPSIEGATRMLGAYSLDDKRLQCLNFDDARTLLDRAIRPTEIVVRNRHRTQEIARNAFAENRWAGVAWWSMHWSSWALCALWAVDDLTVKDVTPLPGHRAMYDAGRILGKHVDNEIA